MKKCVFLLISIFYLTNHVNAQNAGGTVIDTLTPAPSLEGNLLHTPRKQPIAVYLPPSYDRSDKTYPVVYFLPGFSCKILFFTEYRIFGGFHLKESVDRLISEGKMKETIVVIVNGLNALGGHFYVNSPVTGNWEDYMVNDLITFVDNSFRTISSPGSRGICGHSMGGSGALDLAMKHPDVFGSVYALSPGLFDSEGLNKQTSLSGQQYIEEYMKTSGYLHQFEKEEALSEYLGYMCQMTLVRDDYGTAFCYAYGSAFSPDADGSPPYINYLYDRQGDEYVRNKENQVNYEQGFGNLIAKVNRYEENLKKLNALCIDYGKNDGYEWIPEGCRYFSGLLNEKGIKHSLTEFDGDHGNKVGIRMEEFMFPFF
ncbi:MAG: alpha/beta hydrolase-fold protein, partial [Bacteroidales bacterium]